MPEAYFVPKPLSECSSSDLRNYIVAWDAKWPAIVSTKSTCAPMTLADKMRLNRVSGTVLVPGGRWLIVYLNDASVRYFDLQERSTTGHLILKLLIPSPQAYSKGMDVQWMKFDVDFSGNSTYHPSEFNIAAAVRLQPSGLDSRPTIQPRSTPTQINVWRIEVAALERETTGLRIQRRLATTVTRTSITPGHGIRSAWRGTVLPTL